MDHTNWDTNLQALQHRKSVALNKPRTGMWRVIESCCLWNGIPKKSCINIGSLSIFLIALDYWTHKMHGILIHIPHHPRFFPVDPHFAAAPATPDVFRGHIGHGDNVGQLILHFVQQKAVAEVSDHTPGYYPTWGPPWGGSVCRISRPIPYPWKKQETLGMIRPPYTRPIYDTTIPLHAKNRHAATASHVVSSYVPLKLP